MLARDRWVRSILVVVCLLAGARSLRAQCLDWKGGFQQPGVGGPVLAQAVFDDGSGPALYAAGSFVSAGDVRASRIARWNGSHWSALTDAVLDGAVNALTVFDDGSGPALYVGGDFLTVGATQAHHVARWNGSTWSAVGQGLGQVGDTVRALTAFDDGSGIALYAGGSLGPGLGIARWNGASWTAFGGGIPGQVTVLSVFDDGTGAALFAGGEFTLAGGASANSIAKWNGTSWSALGSGISPGYYVRALTVYDAGSGPALVVAGDFPAAGSVAANEVAVWNGSTWSALGRGFDNGAFFSQGVMALTVFDDGAGPELYAGGGFTNSGGVSVGGIAKWNGFSWTLPGSGVDQPVRSLIVFDDGTGSALYVGGEFRLAGGVIANHIARWKSSTWTSVSTGNGFNEILSALVVFDDGAGPALYAGGGFQHAGDVIANDVARWNGSTWSALGQGMDDAVGALTVFDDGTGPALYAGGNFTTAGGVHANTVARWNGSTWSAVGTGASGFGSVQALAVFDDGTGSALYAGGSFMTAGVVNAHNIAKWNGSSWSALGNGLTLNGSPLGATVSALCVFDDGTGAKLLVAGAFDTAGAVSAHSIARWDGANWSAVGSGLEVLQYPPAHVLALSVFDDGAGPSLYAGGIFDRAGGSSANNIARWNGSIWTALGSGTGGTNASVAALSVFDDGSGSALYAGGTFESAGGVAVHGLARWSGSTWTNVGGGLSPAALVAALGVFDDGLDGGPDLYVGGIFSSAGEKLSSGIAEWRGCAHGTGFCFGDGSATACPCGNASAIGADVGCLNSLGTGAKLRSIGVPSVGADSFVLQGTLMPNGPTVYMQSSAQLLAGLGIVFGDGLRCVGPPVVRLGVETNSGGASRYPEPGDAPVHVRGFAHSCATIHYQAWYRNAANYCTASTFNLSNGWTVNWQP